MKVIITKLTVFILVCVSMSSISFAQGAAYIKIQGVDGTSRTAPLDPQGGCTIDNIKPGTYGVALLVPAVQKVREAASRSSADEGHKKWIEVESWSWGATNSSAGHGGGGGAGKVNVHDISVTKTTDKASPKLAEAVAKGKVSSGSPKRMQASQTITHGGQQYYEIKLQDIMVSGLQSTPSTSGDRPMESLSLNFTKITYKVQD